MALEVHDRVKETTTTTGSSDAYALGGAVTGFETFGSHLGDTDTTYYVCTDGTNFEIGIGTYNSSGNTLTRTTILASSNSGNDNVHSWASGTKEIFITYPSSKAVFKDASNNINGTFVGNITGDVTGNADTATALENARAINGVSFNGTGDITVTAAAGTLSGNTLKSTVTASSLTSLGTLASNLNLGGQDIVTTASNQDIDLAAHGTGRVVVKGNDNAGALVLNCEANSHGQTILAAPHSARAANTLRLPDHGIDVTTTSDLVSTTIAQTLTNKTIDSDSNTITNIVNADIKSSAAIANSKLANSSINFGGVSLALGASDTTPAFDLSDATAYPTSSLVGTITNAQLAGSIANSKLANDSVSFGGISLDLGASDATPAFNLSDATNYPTSSLSGTITNAQLAGSIANAKLANSSITVADASSSTAIALGGTLTFSGTSNEVVVGESSGTITIGLPDAITANVTGALTGNADTATALATGRTIGMTGDVVWTSASFTGAGNVTGSATIQAGAVENSMLADDAVGAAELASNAVVNASVASNAAIAFSKMADLTVSRALVSDGSGNLIVSAVTSTEIGHLDGVTSAIQTQIDAKTTATAASNEATALAIALG